MDEDDNGKFRLNPLKIPGTKLCDLDHQDGTQRVRTATTLGLRLLFVPNLDNLLKQHSVHPETTRCPPGNQTEVAYLIPPGLNLQPLSRPRYLGPSWVIWPTKMELNECVLHPPFELDWYWSVIGTTYYDITLFTQRPHRVHLENRLKYPIPPPPPGLNLPPLSRHALLRTGPSPSLPALTRSSYLQCRMK